MTESGSSWKMSKSLRSSGHTSLSIRLKRLETLWWEPQHKSGRKTTRSSMTSPASSSSWRSIEANERWDQGRKVATCLDQLITLLSLKETLLDSTKLKKKLDSTSTTTIVVSLWRNSVFKENCWKARGRKIVGRKKEVPNFYVWMLPSERWAALSWLS